MLALDERFRVNFALVFRISDCVHLSANPSVRRRDLFQYSRISLRLISLGISD